MVRLRNFSGTGSQIITKYREGSHQAMLLYRGSDFVDPHSNAKAFTYNFDNSDENCTATGTWRNAWAIPEDMNRITTAVLAESDPQKRLDTYVELQKRVHEKLAHRHLVPGNVSSGNGPGNPRERQRATSDFASTGRYSKAG